MRIAQFYALLATVMLVVAAISGCSEQTCTPRAYQFCQGQNGCHGVQTCAADGNTWGLCDCGDGLYGTGGSTSTQDAAAQD